MRLPYGRAAMGHSALAAAGLVLVQVLQTLNIVGPVGDVEDHRYGAAEGSCEPDGQRSPVLLPRWSVRSPHQQGSEDVGGRYGLLEWPGTDGATADPVGTAASLRRSAAVRNAS